MHVQLAVLSSLFVYSRNNDFICIYIGDKFSLGIIFNTVNVIMN